MQWLSLSWRLIAGTRPPGAYPDLANYNRKSCSDCERGCWITAFKSLAKDRFVSVCSNARKATAASAALLGTASCAKVFFGGMHRCIEGVPVEKWNCTENASTFFQRLRFSLSFVFCAAPDFRVAYTYLRLLEPLREGMYGAVRLEGILVPRKCSSVCTLRHSAVLNNGKVVKSSITWSSR